MGEGSASLPSTMRALVLSGTGFDHLAVRDVPVPKPGPRQLLARVEAAGVCTSLIKLIEQGPKHTYLNGWDPARHPLILGDEGAVSVVQVGHELRGHYHVGARYVVQPAVDHAPINHKDRYTDQGRGMYKVGVGYTLPGHLAEYMLIPEEVLEAGCLLPLPDARVPHAHVAMSEPLSCVVSGQEHHLHLTQADPRRERGARKGLKPDGVTVIIGAGAMGRMHVDLALSSEVRAVVVSDLIESRLAKVRAAFTDKAASRGIALYTLNAREQEVATFLNGLSQYRGADDVIVAVGVKPVIEQAQQLTSRGGVLNLFGGLRKGGDIIALDSALVHYREIVVTGSSGGSPWDMIRTLELIASQQLSPSVHIAKIADLAHVPEILAMIKRQEIDGKAVVYPHRRSDVMRDVSSWSAEDEHDYLSDA